MLRQTQRTSMYRSRRHHRVPANACSVSLRGVYDYLWAFIFLLFLPLRSSNLMWWHDMTVAGWMNCYHISKNF